MPQRSSSSAADQSSSRPLQGIAAEGEGSQDPVGLGPRVRLCFAWSTPCCSCESQAFEPRGLFAAGQVVAATSRCSGRPRRRANRYGEPLPTGWRSWLWLISSVSSDVRPPPAGGFAGVAGWHHPNGGGVHAIQFIHPGSADRGERRLSRRLFRSCGSASARTRREPPLSPLLGGGIVLVSPAGVSALGSLHQGHCR
jgi:hypothetical protein